MLISRSVFDDVTTILLQPRWSYISERYAWYLYSLHNDE
jgi:hypothetical protein